nr:carbamoyltransferase [Nanoarchaeota archaeon]
MSLYILGISCYYHDAAACLVKDGILVTAAEEERFTREKHDNSFPTNAIKYCLKEAGINSDQLNYVAFYEKPLLKFERILHTFVKTFPKSFWYFYKAVPSWINEKLRVQKIMKKKIKYKGRIFYLNHHLSHAASSYLVSPFKESAILTFDGVGEWATATIGHAKGDSIEIIKEIDFPNSLGLFYSTFTAYLGFKVNNDEYKVMGLAAYGKPTFYEKLRKIIDIREDGSFKLAMSYFDYEHRERMFSKKTIRLLGPSRKKGERITKRHQDIASSIQKITEEIVIKAANHAYKLIKSKNLCFAGGVALNCVANGKILRNTLFKKLFIQPAAGDSGCALGAAFYAYNSILGKPRNYVLKNAYFGPEYSNKEIKAFLDNNNIKYEFLEDKKLLSLVAKLIWNNKIIGWFQGRMEFGPRALGNRSILANPCNPKMKDVLNKKVKHREEFRPFAPAVLAEEAHKYFVMWIVSESPFMLQTFDVRKEKRKVLPSITHVDGTARIQTVSKKQNPRFYELIREFKKLSRVPVVINTSFNVRGEPIVNTPENAYNCFKNTKIDYLIIGNYIIKKH